LTSHLPPKEPPKDPGNVRSTFGWVEVVVWTLGALLLMVFALGLLQGVLPDVTSDMVTLAGTSSAVFLIMTAVLVGRSPDSDSTGAAVGARRLPALAVLGSFLLGILAQFPALFVAHLTEKYFPIPEAEALERTLALRAGTPLHALLLAAFLAVVVPFAEEAFFRGAMFGAVRRAGHSSLFAAACTGSAFLLSHLDPHYWPALALVAMLLSLLRAASGSLLASLGFHVGFNAYTVATATYGLGGKNGELPLPLEVELGLVAFALAIGALLVVYFVRSERCSGYRVEERGAL
jgi:membrane protease YdiL (CAAX protease family)